jgi:hypothetical protein
MNPYFVTIFGAGLIGMGIVVAGRAYVNSRSLRLVRCPQTEKPAAVRLAPGWAILTAVFKRPRLKLRACSHWRERRDCGQTCLRQIEAAPEACLLRNILATWYEGKSCVCCGRPIGEIAWTEHKPCLMSSEPRIYQWQDIPPETIPNILQTHLPVCWNCYVAETHTS